jgi:hypothetical protein
LPASKDGQPLPLLELEQVSQSTVPPAGWHPGRRNRGLFGDLLRAGIRVGDGLRKPPFVFVERRRVGLGRPTGWVVSVPRRESASLRAGFESLD